MFLLIQVTELGSILSYRMMEVKLTVVLFLIFSGHVICDLLDGKFELHQNIPNLTEQFLHEQFLKMGGTMFQFEVRLTASTNIDYCCWCYWWCWQWRWMVAMVNLVVVVVMVVVW